MTVLDRLIMGLKLFAIGLTTVFVVLFLIILIIKIVSLILEKAKGKKIKPAPVQELKAPVLQDVDDGEEIAAVMAAITAYMSTQVVRSANVGFKVRSIKTIINK